MNLFYIAGITYAFWVFYLAAINVVNAYRKGRITKPLTKVLCYPVVYSFLAADFLFNVTLATLFFMDLPQEKTVTTRLKRLANGDGWRMKLARWFASNWVNPFDLTEIHVGYPGAEAEFSQTTDK